MGQKRGEGVSPAPPRRSGLRGIRSLAGFLAMLGFGLGHSEVLAGVGKEALLRTRIVVEELLQVGILRQKAGVLREVGILLESAGHPVMLHAQFSEGLHLALVL